MKEESETFCSYWTWQEKVWVKIESQHESEFVLSFPGQSIDTTWMHKVKVFVTEEDFFSEHEKVIQRREKRSFI